MSAVFGVMCDVETCNEMIVSPHSLQDARNGIAKPQGWRFERGGPGVRFQDFCGDHAALVQGEKK